jgi:hypothetical protein
VNVSFHVDSSAPPTSRAGIAKAEVPQGLTAGGGAAVHDIDGEISVA